MELFSEMTHVEPMLYLDETVNILRQISILPESQPQPQ